MWLEISTSMFMKNRYCNNEHLTTDHANKTSVDDEAIECLHLFCLTGAMSAINPIINTA